jgi:IclR family acetate operon transcriptional repressor
MGRWVEVLTAFLRQDEWGVRELSHETGLPRSAVHRILHEMKRLELLTAGAQAGQFQVGPVLSRIAVVLSNRLDIVRVARPVLDRTMHKTGETAILALYAASRRQVWAVDAVESDHPVRYIWDSLADWRDLHVGATGKGVLAFLPPHQQQAILDSLPDSIGTVKPITKAQLEAQLKDARRSGYVVSRGESFAGAVAVAAPIRDATRAVVGDIVISWPDNRTSRARERELGSIVRNAAAEVSRGLGFVEER